jgi:hypothetical protein
MPLGGHTVLVLGAGASVAEAKGHRPRQERDHPPLDSNFFSRAVRHAERARIDPIESHAERLGQPDLCSSALPVSLEQYLGRLFFEMNSRASSGNVEAYFDLVRWYAVELLTTTNWMMGRNGSIKKLLERELRRSRNLAILTFNHDLLIENALALLAPRFFGRTWCLRHAYQFASAPASITDPSATYDTDCPGDTKSHVPIYKLHGSVNWVFRTRNKYPPPDFARRDRTLLIWNNVQIDPGVESMEATTGRRKNWYLWPLIVPPIYEKHGFIHGELARIWSRAAESLRQAERVIFWGYSFPRADLHARYFFQGAAHENIALTTPILINPDPQSEVHLWEVLKPRRVHHYHDVRDFLADESQAPE